ncbi:DEAD/DEAH box helicase [Azospirillum sp. RWY-5-1]|uniref:DEAD/DEAH box helicase n=2 Tax=Azospirillum oleiclasticum TaxID=2735135 RepID=A0ABX2TBK6_9PROT|nr:DEAD/DEAH box helicase [Azospirillum oleiclasticum]NYZ14087.1 DEAD/DEAH box helicase [Azospirillum oleiclasticum]NYZ21571.1 DEAD/DEAH box helicase [Azospirillum oleiclasticum]
MTAFSDLALRPEIQAAIAAQGYATPTPIQASAIPPALQGRDLLGIAQTGTGKTAAFTLPILQRLAEGGAKAGPGTIRTLILTPTRELAIQIGESIANYGAGLGLRHTVIFGGVGQNPQVDALRRGLDILVATPGRLLDLMNQGHAKLDGLSIFVLDEADRMLDMGFIHDVRKVVAKLPAKRQTMFFSATMPDEITKLANRLLSDPVRVEVARVATTAERIDQRVMHVLAAEKRQILVDLLSADPAMDRVMVFTRTKHGANKVAEHLMKAGMGAAAIHGNKSQNARQAALESFKNGTIRVLVATDIAARGIDIDNVSHVVNFELPNIPESYVHRIGRTARAGASGVAIAFCDEAEERAYLRDIEKLTRRPLTVVTERPPRAAIVPVELPKARPQQQPAASRGRGPKPDQRRDQPRAERAPREPAAHGHGHRPGEGHAPAQKHGHGATVKRSAPPRDAARPASQPQGQRRTLSAFGDLVSALDGAPSGGRGRRR